MASYRALLKTAGKYDKIKALFEKVDRGGQSLDYALKDREELYDALCRRIGYNGDAEPVEFERLLDKTRKMYQYALAAKYLPDEGTLNMSKVPGKYRYMLLSALPKKLRDEIPLPKEHSNTKPWSPGSLKNELQSISEGYRGKHAADLLAAGMIKTYGDLDRIQDPELYMVPTTGYSPGMEHIDSAVIDKSYDPYRHDHNGAMFRTVDGEYLYPDKNDPGRLVYEGGEPFENEHYEFVTRKGKPYKLSGKGFKHFGWAFNDRKAKEAQKNG